MSLRYKRLVIASVIASHLLIMLHSSAFGRGRVPPPREAVSCRVTPPSGELPNARFQRKGGRSIPSKVLFRGGELTVTDVAQGRDLRQYDTLKLNRSRTVGAGFRAVPAQARTFLFEHWRDHKQGYLRLTLSSVDATGTSHIFVEQDQTGRWRVSWRIVRDMGEIADLPTYYSVQWVTPAGFREPGIPLPDGQEPDPSKDVLEFRDKCGEIEQTL